MKNLVFFFAALLLSPSCKKQSNGDGTPFCIKRKIISFEKNAFCSDQSVDAYEFQAETVYVFSSGSCIADGSAAIFDSKCNNKGFLGGLKGNMIIDGHDFRTAKFIRNIWKK